MYKKIIDLEQVPDLIKKAVTNQIDENLKKYLVYFEETYNDEYNNYILADDDKIDTNILYLFNGKIFELGNNKNVIFCKTIVDEKSFYAIAEYLSKYSQNAKRFTQNGLLNILRANRLKFEFEAMCKKIALIHILKKSYCMRFNQYLFLHPVQTAKWGHVNFAELVNVELFRAYTLKD